MCEAQMPQSGQPGTVAAAVARLLGANLAADPKLAAIAARLHVSERTLRRQLSFRDPREFRRAFKRWTGAPPSAARAQR